MGEDRSRGQAPQSVLTELPKSAAHQRGAFFGRRKGHKLRKQQAGLYEELLPKLSLNIAQAPPRDLASLFPFKPEQLQLEIGFGGGEHLLHEARNHPSTGLIGCEPFINGMAKMLAVIANEKIQNIRLFASDALYLLEWLPAASLDRIDILYADPWPKKRHWKRRFISDENVARFARVLKPGGTLRFASDSGSCARKIFTGWPRKPMTGVCPIRTGRAPVTSKRRSVRAGNRPIWSSAGPE